MLTRTKRLVLLWLSIAVFLALVPVAIAYSLGYRFDSGLKLRKTGGLYIAADISGSEIFINSEFQRKTNLLQAGVFVQNLSPKSYEILVLHENYLPWKKILEVRSHLVAEARALLVPRETNGEILLRGKFKDLKTALTTLGLEENIPDSEVFEKLDSRQSLKLTWERDEKKLKALWLRDSALPYYLQEKEELVLEGKELRNFEFFPKRRDAIIAAFDNGVWAVELDGRDKRGLYPIYKGKAPDFTLLPGEEVLYILDEGVLIRAALSAAQ